MPVEKSERNLTVYVNTKLQCKRTRTHFGYLPRPRQNDSYMSLWQATNRQNQLDNFRSVSLTSGYNQALSYKMNYQHTIVFKGCVRQIVIVI